MIDILPYIPKGKENAVTRTELRIFTGLSDRQIRHRIKELRDEGVIILSSSHDKGYWISNNIQEIQFFLRECENRIKELEMTGIRQKLLELKEVQK
jgi:biotin operon repressor